MTVDRRPEIPSGYILKELPGINASMPMPETWFYFCHQVFFYGSFLAMTMNNDTWTQFGIKDVTTEAHFMIREPVAQNGVFTTGMSVNIFPKFSERGYPAGALTREFLEKPRPYHLPIGQLRIEETGSLLIARRFFIMPFESTVHIPSFLGGIVIKQAPPLHYFAMTIENRETGAASIAVFETPSLKWKDDRKIAETMINNTSFSETFSIRPTPN